MSEEVKPLLLKNNGVCDYDNCPGCKQDQWNEANEGIPYLTFFNIWLVTLCSSLPISSLFPFIYFMIQDMHVAETDEDIGVYTGILASVCMFGRALTSVFWGLVADRYGRKPVIVISIFSVIILNTLFGLSTTYWMAITTRTLLGLSSGLLGTMKTYASEVSRKEHQALGISVVNTSWSAGLLLGPAIGGFLAKPAEKFPSIFVQGSLFWRFPYLLPCLSISLVGVAAFVSYLWLPETLHAHHEAKMKEGKVENLENGKDLAKHDQQESETNQSILGSLSIMGNWTLMSPIVVYCVIALQNTAYTEIFSLWAVSSKSYGGLSFSSGDVGEVFAISGMGLLFYQLLLYPKIQKCLGTIVSTRVATVLSIPLLASFPFMTNLSGFTLKFSVNLASLFKNMASATITTGLNILQNNAASQHQRGAANGIAVTMMSFFKAIGPAAAGSLFSWGQHNHSGLFLPGDRMVFLIMNKISVVLLVMTFKPFLV